MKDFTLNELMGSENKNYEKKDGVYLIIEVEVE